MKQGPMGLWGFPDCILSWKCSHLDKSYQWLWLIINCGVLNLNLSSGECWPQSASFFLRERFTELLLQWTKWGCQKTKRNYGCAWGHSEGETSQPLPQHLWELSLNNACGFICWSPYSSRDSRECSPAPQVFYSATFDDDINKPCITV